MSALFFLAALLYQITISLLYNYILSLTTTTNAAWTVGRRHSTQNLSKYCITHYCMEKRVNQPNISQQP